MKIDETLNALDYFSIRGTLSEKGEDYLVLRGQGVEYVVRASDISGGADYSACEIGNTLELHIATNAKLLQRTVVTGEKLTALAAQGLFGHRSGLTPMIDCCHCGGGGYDKCNCCNDCSRCAGHILQDPVPSIFKREE